jgi:helix-turn-helix protein/uncharacterized protein DUF4115
MNTQYSNDSAASAEPADDFDVSLGDLMRGERATLGKSLLDVERELKIKAAHIAAIENADLSVFATKGFVAGYVRSYSRYLGMDPEWCYRRFSAESGFAGVHGTSALQAKNAKRAFGDAPARIMNPNDVMKSARVTFAPRRDSLFSQIEAGALGSAAVLIALVVGLGYGAWSVLTDIQRVQFVPVQEAPATVVSLDPLAGASLNRTGGDLPDATTPTVPGYDPIDRLYRPQALDVPVLTPRDQAIATLDPDAVGRFSSASLPSRPAIAPATSLAIAEVVEDGGFQLASGVQVTADPIRDEVILFAVRPSWIRVSSASGTVLFEGTLNTGDTYIVPAGADTPVLRAGNAGSLYFAVNGVTLGPSGPGASIARDVVLTADALSESYVMADATADPDLPRVASLILSDDTPDGN